MAKPLFEVSTDILVPFYDVDSMEIVWHGNYVKYFEDARCKMLQELDYNYATMRDSGYGWPVVDMRIKYIKPALFNHRIRVHARLVEWEIRLKLEYEIVDLETGETLTKGYSVQVAVDMAAGEMCFVTPAPFRERLAARLGLTESGLTCADS